MTGYGLQWIRAIAQRFNKGGPEAIGDGRHRNPGAKPLLDDQQQALLVQGLEGEPPEGGKWSGPKVAVWISKVLGRPVAPQRGWEYLRELEYNIKVLHPTYALASDFEQQEGEKFQQGFQELEMKLVDILFCL